MANSMTTKTKLPTTERKHMGYPTVPRVISITSGKGGVGKTNIALNLAIALTETGQRVLLLDADLGLANLNVLLGLKPTSTIEHVLRGSARAQDIIINYKPGLDLIPASSGIQTLAHLDEDTCKSLSHSIEEVGHNYDYLLVDTGAGIGNNVTFFNAAADEIIVVINHEPTSLTDAYAIIKVLTQEHQQRHFYVLVNRNPTSNDPRKTFAKLATTATHFLNASLHYLGALPEDSWVSEAVIRQEPYLIAGPNSKISSETKKLAPRLVQLPFHNEPKGGLQIFFEDIVKRSMSATTN